MRHHGAVGKLDHRVNLGLTLHDHVDKVEVATEQMHRLDTLQALVHKGGGVDGDLCPHGPRGMRQGVLAGHVVEILARTAKERTARTGKPNAVGLAWILTQIALIDGGVLGVDRNELTRLRQWHQQVAANDERLLIGKCKTLVRGQGSMARFEPGSAHNSNKDTVDVIATCELANRLRTNTELAHGPCANAELRALGQLLQHSVRTVGGVGHGNGRNRKLTGKRNKLSGTGINGKRRHLQSIDMLTAYIECLRANRARTTQNCNPQTPVGAARRLKRHYSTPPIIKSNCAVMQPKISESLRSSMPPWPGIRLPESLTPTPRLMRDSMRSPITPKMDTTTPHSSA